MEGLILHPSSTVSPSLRTLGVRHVSRGGGGGRGEGGAGAVMGVLSTLELGAWAGRRDRQIEGYTFTHLHMRMFVLRSRRCAEGGLGSPPCSYHRLDGERMPVGVESRLVSSDARFNASAP